MPYHWHLSEPSTFAQQSLSGRFTQSDCAQMCNFCRWLGVDHVHLVHHTGAREHEATTSPLLQYADNGFLTLVQDDSSPQGFQSATYGKCIWQYRERYNWIAYIDVDEYIAVLDKCAAHLELELSYYALFQLEKKFKSTLQTPGHPLCMTGLQCTLMLCCANACTARLARRVLFFAWTL